MQWKESKIAPPQRWGTRWFEQLQAYFYLKHIIKGVRKTRPDTFDQYFFWQEPISCFSIRFQTKAFLPNSINQNDRYLANHKVIGVIFLDFRNAFYEVNHEILLKKLQTYGLGGMVVHLDGSLLIFRSISKGFYWAISFRPTAHLGRREYLKGQYLDSYCVLYS